MFHFSSHSICIVLVHGGGNITCKINDFPDNSNFWTTKSLDHKYSTSNNFIASILSQSIIHWGEKRRMRCTSLSLSPVLLCSCVALGALYVLAAFSPDFGPWGPDNSFNKHPAMMGIAFGLAMPLGLVSYAIDLPGTAIRKRLSDRHQRRRLHAVLNVIAFICCAYGWWAGWSVREAKGKSHLPWGKAFLKQVHIWGGYAAILLVTLQTLAGIAKYYYRVFRRQAFSRWHGRAGPYIWGLGVASLASAAQFSFIAKGFVGTGVATLLLLACIVPATLLLLFLFPRPFLSDSGGRSSTASSNHHQRHQQQAGGEARTEEEGGTITAGSAVSNPVTGSAMLSSDSAAAGRTAELSSVGVQLQTPKGLLTGGGASSAKGSAPPDVSSDDEDSGDDSAAAADQSQADLEVRVAKRVGREPDTKSLLSPQQKAGK